SEEEVGGSDRALAGGADGRDLSLAGHRDQGERGRGIGVREATADGAAIADLIMGYMFEGGNDEGMGAREPHVNLNLAPPHHGAKPHAVDLDPDVSQLTQSVQIDEECRRS